MADNSKFPPTFDKRCGTFNGYKAHQYRKENPCPECRNACAEKAKKMRYENPEKHKKRISVWRDKNKEIINAKHKIWRNKNKDKYNAKNRKSDHKRRALKKKNGHIPYTEQQVLDMYGTDCHICSKPIDFNAPRNAGAKGWEYGLQLDHVIPISSGGSDTLQNVKPSHGLCNSKKHY